MTNLISFEEWKRPADGEEQHILSSEEDGKYVYLQGLEIAFRENFSFLTALDFPKYFLQRYKICFNNRLEASGNLTAAIQVFK